MASETMIQNAKAFLQQESPDSKLNLYDHLCSVMHKILENRTPNSVDLLESLSKEVKTNKFAPAGDPSSDVRPASQEVELANVQNKLFEKPSEEAEPEPEDEVEMPLPDLMDTAHYFEQAGLGLGREETFRIFLALKKLVDTHTLQSVRFWGKILGTEKNYIVAEVEYREGDEEGQEGEEEEGEESREEEADEAKEGEDDNLPTPDYKPPPVIPKEETGTGCNKKTYFVCNEPGGEWTKLPPVTPAQIVCARQIKKFFTGNLEAAVISYPPFPGTEINYLRAQIARISAGTHISPVDYYKFEEDDEDDSDGEGRDSFVENVEFEPPRVQELIDPSLSNWVHHVQHILPQGRCVWVNPTVKTETEDFEDEEEEEEREEPDEPVPEHGPPLLNPISEDSEVDSMPAWSAGLTSNLVPQYAAAVLRSNLWPGACVFGLDKKFENLYIGWGHKYTAENYSPPAPAATQEEYPSGAEVTEVPDPTVDEERALQAVQQEQLDREAEEAEMEEDDEDDD